MDTELRNSGASTNVMGSGIRNVFSPTGKSYYVLEHRASSRFHQAGEQQKIIVDNVVIGRDSSCQVRYDDDFKTVSRKHASIVRDGDRWKLVQLSATNSTFVNGVKVVSEQFLNNGDEIQISANGPKLVFTIPGNASQPGGNMGDLGLTARLQLYSQQALKPYRRALIAGGIALLLAIGGLVWVMLKVDDMEDRINQMAHNIDQGMKRQMEVIDSVENELRNVDAQLADSIRGAYSAANRAISLAHSAQMAAGPAPGVFEQLSKHVYFIQVVLELEGQQISVCSGTAFMLKGGKLVTARHCVDLGYATLSEIQNSGATATLNTLVNYYKEQVKVTIFGVSGSGHTIQIPVNLKNPNWRMGNTEQAEGRIEIEDENGESQEYPVLYNVNLPGDDDWAYIQTSEKDGLDFDPTLSTNLKVGTPVQMLGFPLGMGTEPIEVTGAVNPVYSTGKVGYTGLYSANGCILLDNAEVNSGNSGGPAFALNNNGKVVVIGIVSGMDAQGLYIGTASYRSNYQVRIVPISALK